MAPRGRLPVPPGGSSRKVRCHIVRRRKGPPLPNRRRPEEAGQALLELALVTPLLVFLVMAIFQFAFVIETQMGLTNALREAARRVAASEPVGQPAWTGAGSMTEWVQTQLCGSLTPPCSGGLLGQNVQGFEGSRLVAGTPPVPILPTVAFCSYPVTGASGTDTQYRVQIDLTYSHPLFFAAMGYATDALDGNSNGTWDLPVTAQMRLENIDDTIPGFVGPGACP
jgi:hypothetical protein